MKGNQEDEQQLPETVGESAPKKSEADATSSLLLHEGGLMSPIGTLIADSPANIALRSNDALVQHYSTFGDGEHGENQMEKDFQPSPLQGRGTSLVMHVLLTLAILVGASQVAIQVSSVVQIWSILGSSVSIFIAYIFPCSMYISIRRQSRSSMAEPGEQSASTLFWAWVLLIFASIASVLSTWQAIAQLDRPNCPHAVRTHPF